MAAKKAPGRNGFKYKPCFGLVIVCPDEGFQQKHYSKLKALGYKVRVVCV
jgi:hypothetical protein